MGVRSIAQAVAYRPLQFFTDHSIKDSVSFAGHKVRRSPESMKRAAGTIGGEISKFFSAAASKAVAARNYFAEPCKMTQAQEYRWAGGEFNAEVLRANGLL